VRNKKIINDPVHGFITIPFESTLALIEHPYVQRLRRIKQLGMTDYVYPGAVHTRFHHALGAMHLMVESLRSLISKGVVITDDECEAACAAILLHDIGHGPFSHALEGRIMTMNHEAIGVALMQSINDEMDGKLSLAMEIFQGTYEKPFLHQLVSSQLDMDRMDYLARDRFFTGVTEGLIGHARLKKMLNVVDQQLVVEEKALHSVEKFLHARHFMYRQVYLHKTVLSTEIMLQRLFDRMKAVYQPQDIELFGRNLGNCMNLTEMTPSNKQLEAFVLLDDSDFYYAMKGMAHHEDELLQLLALGLRQRRLFKLNLCRNAQECDEIINSRLKSVMNPNSNQELLKDLIVSGSEKTTFYQTGSEEIKVLTKSGGLKLLSELCSFGTEEGSELHYVSYPSIELLEKYLFNQ